MNRFLETVNECVDSVFILYPDGRKEPINRQQKMQHVLRQQYHANKNHLNIALEVPLPRDYINIVISAIGGFQ